MHNVSSEQTRAMRIKLLFLLPLLLGSIIPGQSETLPQPTLWEHNGSILYLVANGSSRKLYYKEPRPGMVEAGVHPGSLLFHGKSVRGKYVGTAFVFSSRCGQYPYPVSGPILDSYERVVLTGRAPRIAADCSVDGYFDDTLDFRLLKPAVAMPGNAVQPPFGASNPSGRMEVPLSLEGGVLTVPVEINGAITLDFVIDSGAADVNVPADVVSSLIRTRTIRPSDFIAQQTYILADGTEAPSPVFIIRSLKVGGRVVPNVKCSIGSPKSSLLLGQYFSEFQVVVHRQRKAGTGFGVVVRAGFIGTLTRSLYHSAALGSTKASRPNGTQCDFDRWCGACGFGNRLALMSLERLCRCRLGGTARN